MKKVWGILTGIAAGVGAMFFLDPRSGRRRRIHLRDKLLQAKRLTRRQAVAAVSDIGHRLRGAALNTRKALRLSHEEIPDAVLLGRIRTKLGRLVSHPHSVHTTVYNGVVRFDGSLPRSEMGTLLREVQGIPGVKGIQNDLTAYEESEMHP